MVGRLEARLGAGRSAVFLGRDTVSLVVRAALRKWPASVYPPADRTFQGSFGGIAETDSHAGSDPTALTLSPSWPVVPPLYS